MGTVFTIAGVIAALAVLGALVRMTLRDVMAWQNARHQNALDGFTPSMARWGYVGEKRGGK